MKAKQKKGAAFSHSEIAAVDHLITHLQENGVKPDEPVPLTTPVASVVASAVLSTAAVLCVKVPDDQDKLAEIGKIANSLKTKTTLKKLVELRRRAVTATKRKLGKQGKA